MSTWFVTSPRDKAAVKLRLFAIPFAGRGASLFHTWRAILPDWIELAAIQLPGREARMGEAALTRIPEIVTALKNEIVASNTGPYAFFGYSMGALIGFETARALLSEGYRKPVALILGAHQPPHYRMTPVRFHAMSDAEFIAEMQQLYDGIPQEVLRNKDLMKLLLPTLRRDIEALEFFQYAPNGPLDLPFYVYGGKKDPHASPTRLWHWRDLTNAPTQFRWFEGSHFFVQEDPQAVVKAVVEDLSLHVTL
ncbi:thioesterase II family protein [Pseudopelagicola sp. nBUS_19]|uniref:thioesterase II family protein n=1 Tax=Pseudopelagicola sp. nBUS_19 TaxID=3395316 RepID=UPI003EBBFFF6